MHAPAIEAQGLVKRFRKLYTYRDVLLSPWRRAEHTAVDGVSFSIAPRTLFGLLGQNGAGKTTLIKMLTTTLLPTAGTARICGYDLVSQSDQVRRMIGLVSGEERSFYWRLTGRQNLAFFAALRHMPRSEAAHQIEQLLGQVNLSEHADRPFRTYSSGMRQRLAIARGLLGSPQVIFMDEPTRSLDPISARAVRQLITDYIIGELGCTVLLATHSMAEVEELCDRVIFIRRGQVVAEGTISEIRSSLALGIQCELRVRELPEHTPAALERLPGVVGLTLTRLEHEGLAILDLALREEGPVLAAVLHLLVSHGVAIYGCTTRQASTEQIYVHTLGEAAPPEEVIS